MQHVMCFIRKCSTELNDEKEPQWLFPAALSAEVHDEWGLYKILECMGLQGYHQETDGTESTYIKISKNTI